MAIKHKLLISSLLFAWSVSFMNIVSAAETNVETNNEGGQEVINIDEPLNDDVVNEVEAETKTDETENKISTDTTNTKETQDIKVANTGGWPVEKEITIDEPMDDDMNAENVSWNNVVNINEAYTENELKVAKKNAKLAEKTDTGVENYLLLAFLLIAGVFFLRKKFS